MQRRYAQGALDMVDHQEIFTKIKDVLSRHATIKVDETDHETQLTIERTGIWMLCDAHELTIGYGGAHQHYDPRYDNLKTALDRLFNLLTKRKRVTLYSKGNKVFKEKTELQLGVDKFEKLGVTMTWLFPFWQRTTTAVIFEEPFIEYGVIENEVKDVYRLLGDQAPSA